MTFLSEDAIEIVLTEQLQSLGYETCSDENAGPDSSTPERNSYDEVILRGRLEKSARLLNPDVPIDVLRDAIRKVSQTEFPSLLEENRRIHFDVEYYDDKGILRAGEIALVDFDEPEKNDWLAIEQLEVVSGQHNRRPDIVVFVNNLPRAEVRYQRSDHAKMGKGLMFTKDELAKLRKLLDGIK